MSKNDAQRHALADEEERKAWGKKATAEAVETMTARIAELEAEMKRLRGALEAARWSEVNQAIDEAEWLLREQAQKETP